jgi:uncharacterized membrane protein
MAATLLTVAARSLAGPQSSTSSYLDALPPLRTNVSSVERWASLAGGVALVGYGVTNGRLLPSLLGGFFLFRAATGHCPVSQALGYSTADATAENSVIAAGHGTRVEATVVVRKPAAEVYRYWRDFENLPSFMAHLEDVDTTTDGRSRWTAKGPLGLRVQWQAEITADEPGRLIAWKSLTGSDVDTAGSVHFTPKGDGTEVRVELKYDPPAGKVGSAVARLFGENPQKQIDDDLERFRVAVERIPASS